jgi:hypothetical protein
MESGMSLKVSRILFNEAVLLAGASILGTALAYLRETVFAEQLGIPLELIQIELSRCIWATFVVVAGSSPLALSIWFSWSEDPYQEACGVVFALLFIGVFFGQWWMYLWWISTIAVAVVAVVVYRYFGGPLPSVIPEAISRRIMQVQRFCGVVVVAIIGLTIAAGAGWIDAINCKATCVLADKSSMCLVRRYGSDLVFVSFDESTGEMLGEVEVRHVPDSEPLRLRRIRNPVRLKPASL